MSESKLLKIPCPVCGLIHVFDKTPKERFFTDPFTCFGRMCNTDLILKKSQDFDKYYLEKFRMDWFK
jgi:hypothetical protein